MEQMKIIGWVRTDFPEKFGAPRQSGLVRELTGRIEFAPEYRNKEAFRGLDEYSHLWILWQFSESIRDDWSPTVKPPRLGGNRRMGVCNTLAVSPKPHRTFLCPVRAGLSGRGKCTLLSCIGCRYDG